MDRAQLDPNTYCNYMSQRGLDEASRSDGGFQDVKGLLEYVVQDVCVAVAGTAVIRSTETVGKIARKHIWFVRMHLFIYLFIRHLWKNN